MVGHYYFTLESFIEKERRVFLGVHSMYFYLSICIFPIILTITKYLYFLSPWMLLMNMKNWLFEKCKKFMRKKMFFCTNLIINFMIKLLPSTPLMRSIIMREPCCKLILLSGRIEFSLVSL